ncbi:MAG TPA: hypothetical protein VFS47_01700 [Steroidobacteraceae bacterium]|nr:hypothetical protein [Steroidobacteraceae bacterium]
MSDSLFGSDKYDGRFGVEKRTGGKPTASASKPYGKQAIGRVALCAGQNS